MWIKCSEYLLNSLPFRLCAQTQYKGDKDHAARAWVLMQILVMSVNGMFWMTSHDLCRSIPGAGQKSCDRVWDICIRTGVLRGDEAGLSAIYWLRENRFVGNFNGSNGESKTDF